MATFLTSSFFKTRIFIARSRGRILTFVKLMFIFDAKFIFLEISLSMKI